MKDGTRQTLSDKDMALQRELVVKSAALLETLQADPGDLESHVALVYVLLELKRHHAAENVLAAAVRLEQQCQAGMHARMQSRAEARSHRMAL